MRKLTISLTTTPALNNCGIYSKYKPATEAPNGLYGQEGMNPSDSASNLGSFLQQEVFTDPCLRTLTDIVFMRNTDLCTAYLRAGEVEATLLSARLSYLPVLSLSLQRTASNFDGGKTSQTYSLPVSVSWKIDIFGRLANAKRHAQAVVVQNYDYKQVVQIQLAATVTNNYYALLMLDAQIEISTATGATWKKSAVTTHVMKIAEVVTGVALSQTEAACYNVCTTLPGLREQLNQVENTLPLLLVDVLRTLPRGRLAERRLSENLSVGAPLQMLANRPDVRSTEQPLAWAFYTTNAARSTFCPSITLSGSAGQTNSADAIIANPGRLLATAVASLTRPSFNRGANIIQFRITKAQQKGVRPSLEQTLFNAGSGVNNALVQYQMARDKVDHFERQMTSLGSTTHSTQLPMKHGNTTYLEVFTTQQMLLNAQSSQVASRFTETQGIITLYQALGEGREGSQKEELTAE